MKEIVNYRYYILVSMFFTGTALVFSEVAQGESILQWIMIVISTKVAGIAVLTTAAYLFKRWDNQNKIPFLSNLSSYDD